MEKNDEQLVVIAPQDQVEKEACVRNALALWDEHQEMNL